MKEGFLIGGGLLFAGLMLQLSVGPVVWDAFRWPVNAVVLAGFLAIIVLLFLLRKRVYAFQFIGTLQSAIPALVYAVVLTLVMGLTRQTSLTPGPSPEGKGSLWISNMLSFWPFVISYTYLALILGLVVLKQLKQLVSTKFPIFNFQFSIFPHLGLFIVLTTATLGNADMQRLKMITSVGTPEWRALTAQQEVVELTIAIELKDFIMETYDDGSPKRFASDIQVLTKSGKNFLATVEVNKPVSVDGWRIYQYGYDTQMGAMSQTSILELVRDPWLPAVYVGIYMMLAGAVCMFIFGGRRKA